MVAPCPLKRDAIKGLVQGSRLTLKLDRSSAAVCCGCCADQGTRNSPHTTMHELLRYRLWVAGSNSGWQLGIGHDQDVHALVPAIALSHPSASERLPSAGDDDDDKADQSTLPFPPLGWRVDALSSGANHSVAILASEAEADDTDQDGRRQVWITGTGAQGQLGHGELVATQPLSGFRRLDLQTEVMAPLIAAGQLDADANVTYSPKLIACGWNSTYLVLTRIPKRIPETSSGCGDVIVSLGLAKDNAFGELGLRDPAAEAAVHLVDLGSALDGQSLDRSKPCSVVCIAAGLRHAAALIACDADNKGDVITLSLVGWGSARHGQVGPLNGSSQTAVDGVKRSRPGPVAAIAHTPQTMRTWQVGPADLESGKLDLAAGRDHTVALIGGEPVPFGSDRQGQCSLPSRCSTGSDGFASVACNWNGTSLLMRYADGRTDLISAGSNAKGQFGCAERPLDGSSSVRWDLSAIGPDGRGGAAIKLALVAAGSEHTVLLVTRGSTSEVWATGWNEHGNLAQGDEADRHLVVPIPMPDPRWQPTSVWAGCGTTFIQTQSLLAFTRQLPKIELHAHLNGSIRRSTLRAFAQEIGEDERSAYILQRETRTLSEAFEVFDVIHRCVRTHAQIERVAEEMCEDLEEDGVVYAEVRTTPRAMASTAGERNGDDDAAAGEETYVRSVLGGFRRYADKARERRTRTSVRLLLSIDRKGPKEKALRTMDLALRYRGQGVVGIDLSGDPTKGEWEDWLPALQRAKEAGLKVALHAGEVKERDEEMRKMIEFRPDRFGHCCFLSASNLERLRQSRIPLELCLTSNVLSASVDGYASHHFGLHYRRPSGAGVGFDDEKETGAGKRKGKGTTVVLCTDDSAVFNSPLSSEFEIAMRTFGLGCREAFELASEAMEVVFLQDKEKVDETTKSSVRQRFEEFERGWFGEGIRSGGQ
ncbi:alpha tubulin suppressor [Thecaphora frezii]